MDDGATVYRPSSIVSRTDCVIDVCWRWMGRFGIILWRSPRFGPASCSAADYAVEHEAAWCGYTTRSARWRLLWVLSVALL